MINSVGTLVLSFNNKFELKDFEEYLKENKIDYSYFFGNKNILVINDGPSHFEIEKLPKYFVKSRK